MPMGLGVFFAWWLGQLADLLPAWLRRAVVMSDALVIVPLGPLDDPGTVAVDLRRNGETARLGEFALDTPGLSEVPLSANRPTVLQLRRANVLEKTLILPLAAYAELDQVLKFEMDRETPFKPDELYWNHHVETIERQRGRLVVNLLLLPKVSLAPLLSSLARAGIVPRWAEVSDSRKHGQVLRLEGDGVRPQHRSRRLVWPAAICCGLLAFSAVVMPFARQRAELGALDHEVAVGRSTAAQAEPLRGEIDQLSGGVDLVNSELSNAGQPLEVLAAVTQALPDDTYLTDIALQQHKVTLSGRSADAPRLIGALAANGFRDATFAAPVTRVEALHVAIFTIIANDVEPVP
jgi:general secretion pathway protein L